MGVGFAFPFRFNAQGGTKLSSGTDRTVSLVEACVLTNQGGRFRNPQIGVIGYRPLFRNKSITKQHMMRFFVMEAVQAEVPNTLVGEVSYRQEDTASGTVTVGDIALLDTESNEARWASIALGGKDGTVE